MNYTTPKGNGYKLSSSLGDLYLKTDGAITEGAQADRVRFASTHSANDIPEFLEHRRSQARAKLCSIARSVSRLSEKVAVSEAVIQELAKAPRTDQVIRALQQEQERLQVWSLALDMRRKELAPIVQQLQAVAA